MHKTPNFSSLAAEAQSLERRMSQGLLRELSSAPALLGFSSCRPAASHPLVAANGLVCLEAERL